ncbi:related to Myosin regulatory light chain 2-A, smooth muscle isoform [Melanopsichium pennsylvanicum]|uniref:Related to Myosin regulatory light chain 2-A, smooth muscle isoform n=2 Tax=Melanopsichium pennsylvanicum TaxID=63383 RepID=A0AAJ4XGJ6_9BASI|nr:related to Myosin regulatory light chain 2-A, smooth muscle isoform [Melanopsichium pennsylvanicum 4]SNX81994.1 related to Myosin regulatory light chain 2-A, smooth muscle isoform [Melanopsichium pennsylvanicum]
MASTTSSAAAFLNGGAGSSSSASPRKMGNHPRQSSSALYTSFSPKQISGFKEAFNMIDTDSDGLITQSDLATMLNNLGVDSSPSTLAAYFKSSSNSAGLNFTQFLTMFGEHLAELDDERVLMDAFECFDEKDEGKINADELRFWLSQVGDKMTDKEIDRLLSGPFMDKSAKLFDYKAFVEAVKMSEPAELD